MPRRLRASLWVATAFHAAYRWRNGRAVVDVVVAVPRDLSKNVTGSRRRRTGL